MFSAGSIGPLGKQERSGKLANNDGDATTRNRNPGGGVYNVHKGVSRAEPENSDSQEFIDTALASYSLLVCMNSVLSHNICVFRRFW